MMIQYNENSQSIFCNASLGIFLYNSLFNVKEMVNVYFMKQRLIVSAIMFFVFGSKPLTGQSILFNDPCGFPDTTSEAYKTAASGNWGYGYDTLLYDLARWKQSPFAAVDSVGASVQGRTLFVLTIQDSTADSSNIRQRIWVHARTHPGEVQGTWVTNEMIMMLLDTTVLARRLRERYVFYIMPMYNPDGVELGYARQNANGVDIESNWNSSSPQKEVLVLKSQFQKHMSAPNPMRMMLNMHSAYACTRYFVYHAEGGTSYLFSRLEQRFINYVRNYFPGGIRPYNYYVSWVNAPATQYPESWCWSNHKEKIMALTYEDANCSSASAFDSTARAILQGIDSYLQDTSAVTSVAVRNRGAEKYFLSQNFPNPFNPSTTIEYRVERAGDLSLTVYDMLGRIVAVPVNQFHALGHYSVRFDASGLASGIYLYRLHSGEQHEVRTMHFIQ